MDITSTNKSSFIFSISFKSGFLIKMFEKHYCVECPLNLEMGMEKEAV